MPRGFTYDEVKKTFEDAGCTLVSTEYLGNKKKLQYKCNCGSNDIHEITLQDFKRGDRCKNCRKSRFEKTMVEKHGVTHMSHIPEKKEQMIRGLKEYVDNKRHTADEVRKMVEDAGCKVIDPFNYADNNSDMTVTFACGCTNTTTLKRFQHGKRCNNNDCMNEKKMSTNVTKFNTEWYTQTDEYKDRYKETVFNKYGVEHVSQTGVCQNFNLKEYRFPSGRIDKVQGYENFALDILLDTYDERDILTSKASMPEYWYCLDDGKYHRYFPDIWIPKENLIIEVKSTYTYHLHFRINDAKRKAVQYCGQTFKLMLFDDKAVPIMT